jgi:hypothetical protein
MKNKKNVLITCTLLLLFAAGCSLYSVVSTDKDETTDFIKYKTYAWLPDKDNSNNSLNNQIMRNNIKNYFSHELIDNYSFEVNIDTPDVLMEVTVTLANKTRIEEHPVTNTVPNYSSNYSYGYPYQNNPYPQNPHSQNPYYTPQPNQYNYNGYNNNNYNYNNNSYNGYRYQTTYVKEQHNYTESSVTINMIDRLRNELVWTSTAQADIYSENPEYVKSELHPAVHKMMKYFPIKKVEKPNYK